MDVSPKLKETVKYTPLTEIEKQKRNKRIKIGYFLVIFFILLGLPAIFQNFNFKSIDFFTLFKRKGIVKPIEEGERKFVLFQELEKYGFKVKKIKELGVNDYEVELEEGVKVYFNKDNIRYQITSLQFITNRFRIEGRKLKKIDLRFKNPIIE